MSPSPVSSSPTAVASVEVPASAENVYGWVTDLDLLAGFGEEVHAMRWVSGTSAGPGAVFAGANRNGLRRWSTRCTVTDAVPGRRFGFRVTVAGIRIARWEYLIDPLDETSCRVTESTCSQMSAPMRLVGRLTTGVADRVAANQANIEATLQRIRRYAGAPRAGAPETDPAPES